MFRFTIRELVLVTAVVALGTGWWAERRKLRAEVQQLNSEVLAMDDAAERSKWKYVRDGAKRTWHYEPTAGPDMRPLRH